MAGENGHAGFLIIGATAALFGLELVLVGMSPAIGEPLATYLTVAVLAALSVTAAAFLAYGLLTRRALAEGSLTRFEARLELRDFAFRAIPPGVVSVAVGGVWFVSTRLRGVVEAVDRVGISAFGGLGAAFVVLMVALAIGFERQALRVAREEVAAVTAG